MDGPSRDRIIIRAREHWSGWLWLYFVLTAAGLAFAIYERVHV